MVTGLEIPAEEEERGGANGGPHSPGACVFH